MQSAMTARTTAEGDRIDATAGMAEGEAGGGGGFRRKGIHAAIACVILSAAKNLSTYPGEWFVRSSLSSG